ncbi:MAG TPA: undecaprenyl-diphosphate phosphatase [Polyangiales bacterium]
MNNLLQVIVLGVIEGITEFLPISSTGHLLIAEKLGLGARSELFNIGIQAGAIVAVTVIYWRRLLTLATHIRERENLDYVLKLLVAFGITAVLGLLAKKLGFKLPETVTPVAWALIVGGFWILAAERFAARDANRTHIGWPAAILVGIAQIVAGIFPGTSRSGATIFAAMFAGTSDRKAATEFAFLVGIPTMYAATGYALLKAWKASVGSERFGDLGIGFVVSTITAFVAVKWLVRFIQTHSFNVFAYYRIALGVALLLLLPSGA